MNRQSTLLSTLGLVLVLVLFYLFVWQPKSDELATVRTEIDDAVAQQSLLESQIRTLEDVRASAPELEAALVTASTLVPREAALPSALRQLQVAADDSGVVLVSVSPGRPAQDEGVPELASINVAVTAEGSYFQMVDFLRRLEDPAITSRVILFENLSVAVLEYPTLSVALTGKMFAQIPAPPAVEIEPEPTPTDPPSDGETETEEAA